MQATSGVVHALSLHTGDPHGQLQQQRQYFEQQQAHLEQQQIDLEPQAALTLFTTSPPENGQEDVALVGIVEALVTLVEAREYSTGYHSHQVANLALQLALALGLPAAEAQMIALAGQLHDVGKVAVPDHILLKPGVLTEEEWEVMRTHSVVGADVVSSIPMLRPLAPVIRAHHERRDGQGYPDHLAAEAIPLGARILTVVDAYQAMIMHRPYRQARAPSVALAELCHGAGSQFDPRIVELLIRLLRQWGDQTKCKVAIH